VAWLKEEEVIQDLVESAQKKMKDQGVIRNIRACSRRGRYDNHPDASKNKFFLRLLRIL